MSRRKRYTRNLGRRLPEPLPHTLEWVRFEHATQPYGVFRYSGDAQATLPGRPARELVRLTRWFCLHLDAPDGIELGEARFWFRAEASEYVGRARRLAELVTRAGFPIAECQTLDLRGHVRWQDAYQLAVLIE
jgi:hypothetical protein